MTALVWDRIGERAYESGVSNGVLYGEDGVGIAWNGITSVDENVTNSSEPVIFDGVKFNDIVTLGDFEGVLRAFTYPDEFLYYEGTLKDQTGFYIKNQPQTKFGLSYKTLLGNDLDSEVGYKIHVLYNLTALPSQRSYKTLSLDVEPIEFEWDITGVPEDVEYFRASAHLIFDSRQMDPFLMQDIQDILYGTEDKDPYLPPAKALASFIRKWNRLIVVDNGDGTWTATSMFEEDITMLDETTFQIVSDTAVYLDPDTYTITSSEKNEEDIWQP